MATKRSATTPRHQNGGVQSHCSSASFDAGDGAIRPDPCGGDTANEYHTEDDQRYGRIGAARGQHRSRPEVAAPRRTTRSQGRA